jgi:hypothetical protein
VTVRGDPPIVDTASADAMQSAASAFTVISCHLDHPPAAVRWPGQKVHVQVIETTSRVQVHRR